MFRGTVVGKKRVGVLEECDQDKPVVDPYIIAENTQQN